MNVLHSDIKKTVKLTFYRRPFFGVQAIIDVQTADFAFYQIGVFQFLQMLANRRTAQWQFVGDVARNTRFFRCQKFHDGDSGRVRKQLGGLGELLQIGIKFD